MATESREYPARIWAGHLGGGRRIWKPELLHESKKDFACEYVRADVAADLLAALTMLRDADDMGAPDGHNFMGPTMRAATDAAIAKATGGAA